MIGRRQWLKGSVVPGLAAWAVGGAGVFMRAALGQTAPAPKGSTTRRTVRRPAMTSTKDTARTVPDPRALPPKPSEALNKLLEPVRGGHHLPGMIGAVLTGDGLSAIGAVGIRKIGSSDPMRVTDQVHIGSCTKALTATLIGMLVEERLVELVDDDPRRLSRGRFSPSRRLSEGNPLTASHSPRRIAARRFLVELAWTPTTDQRRAALGPDGRNAAHQAWHRVRVFERRLRAGGFDGRADDRSAVGSPAPAEVVRAVGHGLGGLRAAGRPGQPRGRSALGPPRNAGAPSSRHGRTTLRAWGRPARSIARFPTGRNSPRSICGPNRASPGCSRQPLSRSFIRLLPAWNMPAAGLFSNARGPAARP